MDERSYFDIRNERSAEEALPRMSYGALVDSLGRLTQLGVLAQGTASTMLTVARLVDRGRIERSGLSLDQMQRALETYRGGARWKPVPAVVFALERAIETMSENEVQAAANGAR
jgi:hypothetical protein